MDDKLNISPWYFDNDSVDSPMIKKISFLNQLELVNENDFQKSLEMISIANKSIKNSIK